MATKALKPAKTGSIQWFRDCVARSSRGVFAETVEITPSLAAEMLKNNPNNRHTNPTLIQQFAADMRADRWTFNGEPFIIARSGEVNDGQHRLYAIIDSATPILALIVFGLERESRMTVDMGAKRSAGDFLGMKGVINANITASITRMLIGWEKRDGRDLQGTKHVTIPEQIERALNDPAVKDAAEYAAHEGHFARHFMTASPIGFCFLVLSRVDPSKARAYMDSVCIGENLKRGDPAFVVRERLMMEESRHRQVKIGIVLRGWTFYRKGMLPTNAQIHGKTPFPDIA